MNDPIVGVLKNVHTHEKFFGTIRITDAETETDICAEKTDLVLIGNPFVTPQTGRHRVLALSSCEIYAIDVCPTDIPAENQFD